MAPFPFLPVAIIISATICLTCSSTTIPTSPAFLGNSPPLSSYQQLSPDIAPLLPTPGGKLPSPSVTSIPNIPSNPSFQFPDELTASAPAFPPMAMGSDPPPLSSASHHNSAFSLLSLTFLVGALVM
ncbi:hypothetical protein LINGRAPRIM_LOCUS2204 [Linum grandiflorum]